MNDRIILVMGGEEFELCDILQIRLTNILNTDTRRSNVQPSQLAAAPQPSVVNAEISTIITSEEDNLTATSTSASSTHINKAASIATLESSNDPREPTNSASEDQ